MTCESVEGKWGGICPACGERLPVKQDWSHGRPCARPVIERYPRERMPRADEIAATVARLGGNTLIAARDLGISRRAVQYAVKRHRLAA